MFTNSACSKGRISEQGAGGHQPTPSMGVRRGAGASSYAQTVLGYSAEPSILRNCARTIRPRPGAPKPLRNRLNKRSSRWIDCSLKLLCYFLTGFQS